MSPRSLAVVVALLLVAAAASGYLTPGAPVTDATVMARIAHAASPSDELALSEYYYAKAKAEDGRIDATERIFRAYMQLEGKQYEPLREASRKLLRDARYSKKHYEMLASAHHTLALEAANDMGPMVTPTAHH